MTTDIIYQSNHSFIVGRGPHTCGAVGCVLCSSVMALRDLGIAPDLTPEEFNAIALAAGAFDDPGTEGDELDVAKACARWPVRVEDRLTEGLPYELARIFGDGGRALIRVGFTATSSDHTILGVSAFERGGVACLDPAIGHVALDNALTARGLGWGHDASGKHIVRDYRAVNVRGIFRVQ